MLSENKMKHYIIGEILENGEIVRGETAQGYVYKNSKAFYDKTNEVCYIPELHDTEYTYEDFMSMCGNSFEVASDLFDVVDWQSPESQLEDYISNDEVSTCTSCDKMFLSYEVYNCPYCNHPKED